MAQAEPITEFSSNFDAGNVRPFLLRVAPLVESGFGEPQIGSICAAMKALAVDQECAREFPISHRGQTAVLQIRIVMDDIDAPDVYIFTPASLTSGIEGAFVQFANELGI